MRIPCWVPFAVLCKLVCIAGCAAQAYSTNWSSLQSLPPETQLRLVTRFASEPLTCDLDHVYPDAIVCVDGARTPGGWTDAAWVVDRLDILTVSLLRTREQAHTRHELVRAEVLGGGLFGFLIGTRNKIAGDPTRAAVAGALAGAAAGGLIAVTTNRAHSRLLYRAP